MEYLWIGFIGGFLASAHCLGMCGGFALYLSRQNDRRKMIAAQFLWHVGRTFMYAFLGALAGYTGRIAGELLQQGALQKTFGFVTGLLILLMGLMVLGLLPVGGRNNAGEPWVASLIGKRIAAPTPGLALILGLATGCLPCPVVIGFLAYSLKAGSVAGGMLTMAGMGMGTMISLLLLGAGGRLVGLHARRWGQAAGGIILILLGLSTMLRGGTFFHTLLGCGKERSVLKQPHNGVPPCCIKEKYGTAVDH